MSAMPDMADDVTVTWPTKPLILYVDSELLVREQVLHILLPVFDVIAMSNLEMAREFWLHNAGMIHGFAIGETVNDTEDGLRWMQELHNAEEVNLVIFSDEHVPNAYAQLRVSRYALTGAHTQQKLLELLA